MRQAWSTAQEAQVAARKRLKVSSSDMQGTEACDGEEFILNEDQFNQRVLAEYTKAKRELLDYCLGRGAFGPDCLLETEDDWIGTDGSLRFSAIKILNMACTISDIERLHKVYSLIHTPTRSSLTDDRVDRLSMAHVISQLNLASAKG